MSKSPTERRAGLSRRTAAGEFVVDPYQYLGTPDANFAVDILKGSITEVRREFASLIAAFRNDRQILIDRWSEYPETLRIYFERVLSGKADARAKKEFYASVDIMTDEELQAKLVDEMTTPIGKKTSK